MADAVGNVAKTATANVSNVRDYQVFSPIANGTSLAGITGARQITNINAAGMAVHECVLGFDDNANVDEMCMSGNMAKPTPVSAFEDRQYQVGPVTRRLREMYWDWDASAR